jgi:protein ImuB
VPARVAVVDGRPVRVTTDRRGFSGGAVTRCAGPWRTSGNWWSGESGRSGKPGGEASVSSTHQTDQAATHLTSWNRDEWDVSLGDGAVYRVCRDRDADRWFIDAIVD